MGHREGRAGPDSARARSICWDTGRGPRRKTRLDRRKPLLPTTFPPRSRPPRVCTPLSHPAASRTVLFTPACLQRDTPLRRLPASGLGLRVMDAVLRSEVIPLPHHLWLEENRRQPVVVAEDIQACVCPQRWRGGWRGGCGAFLGNHKTRELPKGARPSQAPLLSHVGGQHGAGRDAVGRLWGWQCRWPRALVPLSSCTNPGGCPQPPGIWDEHLPYFGQSQFALQPLAPTSVLTAPRTVTVRTPVWAGLRGAMHISHPSVPPCIPVPSSCPHRPPAGATGTGGEVVVQQGPPGCPSFSPLLGRLRCVSGW